MQDLKSLLSKYKEEPKKQDTAQPEDDLRNKASLQAVANSIIASTLMTGAK